MYGASWALDVEGDGSVSYSLTTVLSPETNTTCVSAGTEHTTE